MVLNVSLCLPRADALLLLRQCILAEGKKVALAVGVTTMSTADM